MQTIARAAYYIPVFGWMLKEAVRGPDATKFLFIVNLMLIWFLAIVAFGYPAIILPALVAVPCVFLILIAITKG